MDCMEEMLLINKKDNIRGWKFKKIGGMCIFFE